MSQIKIQHMLLYSAITPKSEDKYVVKVFNWSEFHLSEMTLLQNPYFRYLHLQCIRINNHQTSSEFEDSGFVELSDELIKR